MKSLFLVLLAFAAITAPIQAETFRVKIEKPEILALIPQLCAALKNSLPEQRQQGWTETKCVKRFAVMAMTLYHVEMEKRISQRQQVQRRNAATDVFKEAPLPPTPTATPSATPSPTP